MFVMDYYGHKLFNGVLFAHHLILDVPGGSPHLGYRRRVRLSHNPPTRVKKNLGGGIMGVRWDDDEYTKCSWRHLELITGKVPIAGGQIFKENI